MNTHCYDKSKKLAKVIFRYLVCDETCRSESRGCLEKQTPEQEITSLDIDEFIKNIVVPSCIEDGTAAKMVREYRQLIQENKLKKVICNSEN